MRLRGSLNSLTDDCALFRIDWLRIMEREVVILIRFFKFKLFIAFQRFQCICFLKIWLVGEFNKFISGAARGPPGEQRRPHQPAARTWEEGQRVKGRRRGHFGFGDAPGSRGGNVRRCRGRRCSSPGRLARAQHQFDGDSCPVG